MILPSPSICSSLIAMTKNNEIRNLLQSLNQLNDEQLRYVYNEIKKLYDKRVIKSILSIELTKEEISMLLQRDN